ncbi:MAG: hypothetical protein JXQ23_12775 [Clostridia bacterium]|nr:hypothetical protein [Clostridia bacterium]
MFKVNYETARKEAGFNYSVSNGVSSLMEIADLTYYEINTDYKAGIKLYSKENVEKLDKMFDYKLSHIAPSTGHISYGHLSCLGMELVFPEGGGDVNYVHENKSMDEWIKILKKDIELSDLAKKQLEYREQLQKAFPGEKVGWTFGYEGPMTTAYELRDMNVFYDVYDDPEKFKEFLTVMTKNTVEYIKIHSKINGNKEFSNDGWGLCDDIASMFSPDLWEEFVLPYWEIYYNGVTDGKRFIHVEDLNYKHVKHLEKANINMYDPSVSAKLNPPLIFENTRVPFKWRLNGFHYDLLTVQEVSDWVYKAAADGASEIFSIVTHQQINESGVKKVLAFEKACRECKKLIDEGIDREQLNSYVSEAGKERFWANWHE